jgi:hypothetical protein
MVTDPDDPAHDDVFTRCCGYNWHAVIASGLVTARPELATCPGRSVAVLHEGPVVTGTGKVLGDADMEKLAAEAERGYDVLGKDATACCVAHRRVVRWTPAPGWWVHASWYTDAWRRQSWVEGGPTCTPMLAAPSPLVFVPRTEPEEGT